jgi:sulfur carrier protein
MNLTINGQEQMVEGNPTLAELLTTMGKDPRGKGLAVALNGEVVPRADWPRVQVGNDDKIELLEAAQGG